MSHWVHEHLLQLDSTINTFDKLSSRSFTELYNLVAYSVKPMDAVDFVQSLIKYTEFPKTTHGYIPEVQTYKKWYGLVLKYLSNFREVYDLLSIHISDGLLPVVNNRPTGLINILLRAIPHQYGILLWSLIPEDLQKKSKTLFDVYRLFYKELDGERSFHCGTIRDSKASLRGYSTYSCFQSTFY